MIYDFKSVEIINSGVIISELREEIWRVREPLTDHMILKLYIPKHIPDISGAASIEHDNLRL